MAFCLQRWQIIDRSTRLRLRLRRCLRRCPNLYDNSALQQREIQLIQIRRIPIIHPNPHCATFLRGQHNLFFQYQHYFV